MTFLKKDLGLSKKGMKILAKLLMEESKNSHISIPYGKIIGSFLVIAGGVFAFLENELDWEGKKMILSIFLMLLLGLVNITIFTMTVLNQFINSKSIRMRIISELIRDEISFKG